MEALIIKDIAIQEVFLHLVELVATDSVDITAFELFLKDLRDGDLREVGAHAEEIAIHNESILFVAHLCGVLGLELFLGRVLSGEGRDEISIGFLAHVCLTACLFYYIIIIDLYIINQSLAILIKDE